MILADRGFTVQDLLNPLQADIKIPSFLKGRSSLSAAEELSTRKNAKARIHVERFNERVKSFRLQSVSWSLAEFRHNKILKLIRENCFNVCRQLQRKVRFRKHDV